MIIVRATQRLLKASGTLPDPEPPPPTATLGEWFANAIPLPFRGRTLVLYVNSVTFLTVAVPGRTLGTTLPIFRQRLPKLLLRLGAPGKWIAEEFRHLDKVAIAKTNSRVVLGVMNDIAFHARWLAEDAGSWERFDLDDYERKMAGMPMSPLKYHFPNNALENLLGLPHRTLGRE